MELSVSVKEAAALLEKSQGFIRMGLQNGILPIGVAVKMSSKWTYHISRKLLYEYIGIPERGKNHVPIPSYKIS